MFWAACPRSNRIDSGASAVAGFGVTRAIATAAPARCPAHGPTAASSARWARSRQTMNVQRCWFLLLPECRPASRIRSRCAGFERALGEAADDALGRDRLPDRVRRGIAHDSRGRRGCGERRRLRLPRQRRTRGARKGHLGEGPEAARQLVDGLELDLQIRDAHRLRLGRDLARGGRVERTAQGGRKERSDGASIARVLVQPRVRSAGHDECLDWRRIRLIDA